MAVKIVAEGLSRTFAVGDHQVVALDGFDLEIADGEFCCIVGPSGCGKSTVLRALAGLDPIDGRLEIAVEGRDATSATATVFQDHGLFPWMRVVDNVAFGLKAQGWPKRERRAAAVGVLDSLGLAAFAHAYPHQLSGGMRQRVAIARVFATDPDVLLMDEPLSAVDEQTRILLQKQLTEVWEQSRKTVLYVTHSIDEAILLGDRVVVMTKRPGRVKEIVDASSVFARPRDVEAVKASPEFGRLFARIWNALREEVVAVEPQGSAA